MLFVLLGLIWGSVYLAVKIGGDALGPFSFVSLRLAIGAAFLLSLIRTVVNYVIPVVGVSAGAILLGETVGPTIILGGLLVVAGVAIATRAPRVHAGMSPAPQPRISPSPA